MGKRTRFLPLLWISCFSLCSPHRLLSRDAILERSVKLCAYDASYLYHCDSKHFFRFDFPAFMGYSRSLATQVANGVFGGLCIALFGNDTQPNVVENMEGSIYTTVVKVVLCADLLFTVPIVLAASRSLLEDSIVPSFPEECDTHVRNILRIILTVIVATIYLAIPSFSDLVTLIGGVVNCLMGFILPSVFYMRLKHIDGELTVGSLVGHSCIVVVGIIAAGASLVVTLISIVETHS
eukprot:gb/GECG01000553.1/.p1 GENE.gb/GECG01000553.1/~~gb/GECG01000553.1/.p1  ORF type:complete len:237 (+),score=6.00 gb/GECG01000553.1/:1-711(+)